MASTADSSESLGHNEILVMIDFVTIKPIRTRETGQTWSRSLEYFLALGLELDRVSLEHS